MNTKPPASLGMLIPAILVLTVLVLAPMPFSGTASADEPPTCQGYPVKCSVLLALPTEVSHGKPAAPAAPATNTPVPVIVLPATGAPAGIDLTIVASALGGLSVIILGLGLRKRAT